MKSLWTSNHMIWSIGLIGAVASYVALSAGLLTPNHADEIKHVALIVAAICAKLGPSPLPS